MKIAAIKGKMGIWTYYVASMRFSDISEYVSPITEEISNNNSFSDMLQRAITDNVESIKEYLLNQKERFFNALVLAIYDGNPEWCELEVDIEEFRTYSIGILELSGKEVIFPVDGQHRVEGIKKALIENSDLCNERVPVIFIGHQNTRDGKQRTRRLFSTLNRRARRVNDNELIALDEDDVVAVATREIIENNPLFSGDRIANFGNKNIPSSNHVAFTSIIELYQCNKILFNHIATKEGKKKKDIEKMLLYRPDDETTRGYIKQINDFWCTMSSEIPVLKTYIDTKDEELKELKNRDEEGGNYFFRPVALTQYINALCEYITIKNCDIKEAVIALNKAPIEIHSAPWLNVIWTQDKKINGRIRSKDVKNMFLYCADHSILSEQDKQSMLDYWASSLGREEMTEEDLLNLIE